MTILTKLLAPGSRPDPTSKKKVSHTYKAVAEAVGNLRQYQDIPQRFQKQWITTFLPIVTVIGIVAGLYLNVVSRSAITGREIQNLQVLITANQRTNADLQTQIATLLSSDSLRSRAIADGYVFLNGPDLEYITVPGYFPQQALSLVSPVPQTGDIVLSPEYSESLLSWISRQIEAASQPLTQGQ